MRNYSTINLIFFTNNKLYFIIYIFNYILIKM